MTTQGLPTNRWDTEPYIRIDSATYDKDQDRLTVRFCNGDTVTLTTEHLLRPEVRDADWEHIAVVEHYHISVPVAQGSGDAGTDVTDLPGFAIRSLTDADFAAHLARQAEASARRVGERLQRLRKQRGLTTKEVAGRVGMAQQHVSRIEHGRHTVSFPVVEKLLAAMGYTLSDLLPLTESAAVDATR